MQIRRIKDSDIKSIVTLFNDTTKESDFLYEKLDEKTVNEKFVTSKDNYDIYTFIAEEDHQLIGFSSGVYDKELKKAYITMLIVNPKYQRQAIGSKLLHALELKLLEQSLDQKKIEVVFFNPVGLSWLVPHTKAVHPNAPGVDKESRAYQFLKVHKYIDFAVQNVYYMDIKTYSFSDTTKSVIKSVEDRGFKFAYFDIDNDSGLEELLDNLGSPVWKKTVLNHTNKLGKLNTLLIPTYKHKVAGFTGPLIVEPNGRGYFAGIGTHSDFRGFGLGKALFAKLVMGLKELGAEYMTLFTGENNPARRMYEKEGFKIVRTFIDLRKVDF